MRIGDLPADHPARRSISILERPDDWRHPNSGLTAGQWREVFAMLAQGATYGDVEARFPVRASTVASMAGKLGLQRSQRARAEGEPPADDRTPDPETAAAIWGVTVDPADPEATRAAFWRSIQRAAREGRFAVVDRIGRAKERVDRLIERERKRPAGGLFPGGYRPSGCLSPQTPVSSGGYRPSGYMSPQTPGWAGGLVLRDAQKPPEGDWSTWLFLGGRGAGKTLAGASWIADMAERLGPGGRLALIGATLHDVREVMIEGPSGVMSLPRWTLAGPDGERGLEPGPWRGPVYQPSRWRPCTNRGGCGTLETSPPWRRS